MTQTHMSPDATRGIGHCLHEHAQVDVRTWRLCCLLDAGFDDETARSLAGCVQVDLHALLELVDRGCPPSLAARILAPLTPSAGQT